MGHILDSTEAMGEYSAEVRDESFYVYGEEGPHDSDGALPRHVVRLSGERLPGEQERRPTDNEFEDMLYLLDMQGPGGRRALERLKAEARRARRAEVVPRRANYGSAEFLIEDIPKLRAVLDAVEAHVEAR